MLEETNGFDLEKIKSLENGYLEFYEFCYFMVQKYQNDDAKLRKLAKELDTSVYEIRRCAKKYKERDEKYDYHKFGNAKFKKEVYQKNGYDKINGEVIENLLKANTIDEIVAILKEKENNLDGFVMVINGYIMNMYPEKSEELIKNLKGKIAQYRAYLKSKNKNLRLSEETEEKTFRKSEALKLAKEILKSDDETQRLGSIPDKYNIAPYSFELIKRIWISENVYDLICQKLEQNKFHRLDDYADKIRKILPLLDTNAITVGSQTRSFDVVDLYTYFRDDANVILELAPKGYPFLNDVLKDDKESQIRFGRLKSLLNKSHFRNHASFSVLGYNSNEDLEQQVMDRALKNRREINYTEFDKDGFPVAGSGHVLTTEDKMVIFKTIKEINLPITSSIYDLMIRRFNNGKLELITEDNVDEYLKNSAKNTKK